MFCFFLHFLHLCDLMKINMVTHLLLSSQFGPKLIPQSVVAWFFDSSSLYLKCFSNTKSKALAQSNLQKSL